jgi:NADPH:quinone reductase-like Zn-dependent oxidoreductase
MQLQQIPSVGVGSYIASLAKRHGVSHVRTGSDALADVITRLADDEVVTDETEDMIVALRRANVIDGPTMVSLLGRYLDEKRHV